jgi:hypothetical protein
MQRSIIRKQIKGPSRIIFGGWVLVAHAYHPSYLGGRDQVDCGSKPAQANSS